MTDVSVQSSAADGLSDAEPLVCPHCGYDLRGATADRCSECGQAIDHAMLRTSGFPWAHRRERGRVRTYLHTLWLVTAGSRRIAHEASRPQKLADANAFRRVTAALVAVALLGAFGILVVADGGLAFLAVPPPPPGGMPDSIRWMQDVIIPWSAGATLGPMMPLVSAGWAIYVTGVQRRLFRLNDVPRAQRDRAEAVADYAVAPVAFLLPAVVWAAVVALLIKLGAIRESQLYTYLIPTWLLWGVGMLLAFLRIVQWSIRARRDGLERIVLAVPHLLGLWLFGFVAWLLFIPWSVGFFWLVIDSLRR